MRLPGHGHPLPDGIDGPLQRDPSRLLISPQAGQEPCLHQRPLASPHVREWGECTEHSVWDQELAQYPAGDREVCAGGRISVRNIIGRKMFLIH